MHSNVDSDEAFANPKSKTQTSNEAASAALIHRGIDDVETAYGVMVKMAYVILPIR